MNGASYLIFYDGLCQICRRGCQAVERLRPTAPVRFIDVNDTAQMARFPQIPAADARGQMYVLEPGGRVTGGYDALVSLSPILPAFAWLTPLLALAPVRAIGRRAYRWVADNRYLLGGQAPCHAGACGLNQGVANLV
jgi:predicted DCC family thiol-disulfide oxidoreductase YuxK